MLPRMTASNGTSVPTKEAPVQRSTPLDQVRPKTTRSGRPIRRLGLAAVAAVALLLTACSAGSEATAPATTATASTVATATTAVPGGTDLAAVLDRAWREEQHALATYQNVIDALGPVRPFTNIVRSEAQHVAALEQVALANGVTLPSAVVAGEPAPGTVTASCDLGATAEKADAALYDELIPLVQDHPDVVQVMQNLRAASLDNHLPAFERCDTA